MRTVKCLKLEGIKMIPMMRFMMIFLLLDAVITIASRDLYPSFAVLYMIFGAMCVCSNNFFQTGGTDIFTLVLPSTAKDRVIGRYLFGALMITGSMLAGMLLWAVVIFLKKQSFEGQSREIALMLIYLGIGYVAMALQFAALYLTRIKNMQVLAILRMVPAFVLFFGMNAIVDSIRGNEKAGKWLTRMIAWGIEHSMLVAVMMVVFGMITIGVCIWISWMHEKKQYE